MSRLVTAALFLALTLTVAVPTMTFAADLAADTDPRLFVLDVNDLGVGYRLNTEQSGPRPNETAAGRDDIQRYQQWGRIGGYSALFEREPGVLSALTQTGVVTQAVSLYRTSEGAQAAFEYSRQRNGQQMELLGTPLVGEASLAFRAALQRASNQPGPAGEAIVIQFRKGNLVQSLIVVGPQGAPVFDEALALAQVAASRVPD